MEIVAVNLQNDLKKDEFNFLISHISVGDRRRIKRFRNYEDAQRTLVGYILVRYLLCKRLRKENYEIVFELNAYGKPTLKDIGDVFFNISHSGKWVVCCIDTNPVGIDVEQIKFIDMGIADRFFSKEEVILLESKESIDRNDFFYELWTLKESYIKAIGKGLSIPLYEFSIVFKENRAVINSKIESENYYFKQYDLGKNYKMAVCASEDKFASEIEYIDSRILYDKFNALLF